MIICVYATLASIMQAQAATPPAPAAPQSSVSVRFDMPKSHNPINAYAPEYVPEPVLANSPRLDRLIRDGKLYLALKDCNNLALENNLDLAIARYN
ncbi:MAG: TolC family protein, partial [Candidatus Sulfotelmatobacter sp.]